MALAGCASDRGHDDASSGALGGLPFASLSDVVTYGDFAAVVTITGEREFEARDITPPHDGAATTVPRTLPDDRYVDRVVTVQVDEVVWSGGRVDVPAQFEMVDSGWETSDDGTSRRPVAGASGLRLEPGGSYFSVFTRFGAEWGAIHPDGTYAVEEGKLSRTASELGASLAGPAEFDGLPIDEIGDLLAATPIDPAAAPFMDEVPELRAARAMGATWLSETSPPTSAPGSG